MEEGETEKEEDDGRGTDGESGGATEGTAMGREEGDRARRAGERPKMTQIGRGVRQTVGRHVWG